MQYSFSYVLSNHLFFCSHQFQTEKSENEDMWLRTSDASSLSADDVAAKLKVDKSVGLGWKEADLRRQLIGFNEFSFKEGDPPWKKYIEQVSVDILKTATTWPPIYILSIIIFLLFFTLFFFLNEERLCIILPSTCQ